MDSLEEISYVPETKKTYYFYFYSNSLYINLFREIIEISQQVNAALLTLGSQFKQV